MCDHHWLSTPFTCQLGSRVLSKIQRILGAMHNITSQCGLWEYNSGMLGAQFEFESRWATFWASRCYIMRAHKTRAQHWVMLCGWKFGRHVATYMLRFNLGLIHIGLHLQLSIKKTPPFGGSSNPWHSNCKYASNDEFDNNDKYLIEVYSSNFRVSLCYQSCFLPNDLARCIPLGVEHPFAFYALMIYWKHNQCSHSVGHERVVFFLHCVLLAYASSDFMTSHKLKGLPRHATLARFASCSGNMWFFHHS